MITASMPESATVSPTLARPVSEAGASGHLSLMLAGAATALATQRAALAAFAIRIGSAALLYASQILLARWMGDAEYGVYVVAWTVVLALGGVSSLGLNQAVMRLVPEYRARGVEPLLNGLVRGSLLASFATGTLVAALGLAGLVLLGPLAGSIYVMPIYLALACVPIYAVTDVQDGIGRGRGWMGLGLLPPYVLRPLLVLVAMVVAHALDLPMTATTAMGAAILGSWAAGVLQLALLQRRLTSENEGSARVTNWRAWLSIALPLMLITAAEIALQCADVLILARWIAPGEVAIYYAAAKTMSLILYVHYSVGSALAGRLVASWTKGDEGALERTVAEAVRWTFWPSLLTAAALLAIGQPLLSLFGSQFAAGYPVMLVLVLGYLARSAVGPSDILLRMLGEHRLSAAISVATAVLNIALLLLLIPRFGVLGAATATAAAVAIEAAGNWLALRRRLGLHVGVWQVQTRTVP